MVINMTKYANVRLPSNLVLEPMLEKVVEHFSLSKPKWIFTCTSEDPKYFTNTVSYSPKPIGPDGQPAPITLEGDKKFLHCIRIIEKEETLGKVTLLRHWRRQDGYITKYEVDCWRINNRNNAVRTEKLNVAIRTIKKNFVARSSVEFWTEAQEAVNKGLSSTIRSLETPISQMKLIKNVVALQKYAYCTAKGLPIPDNLNTHIKETFLSDGYERTLACYELAQETISHQKAKKLMTIVELNGSYLFADQDDQVMQLDYEGLPIEWQEKIAVLNLMSDNEVIKDVGYRESAGQYAIIV